MTVGWAKRGGELIQVKAIGIARPCSAADLQEEEATAMARTYREIATEEMIRTVEEAMKSRYRLVGGPATVDERSDRAVSRPIWGGN